MADRKQHSREPGLGGRGSGGCCSMGAEVTVAETKEVLTLDGGDGYSGDSECP